MRFAHARTSVAAESTSSRQELKRRRKKKKEIMRRDCRLQAECRSQPERVDGCQISGRVDAAAQKLDGRRPSRGEAAYWTAGPRASAKCIVYRTMIGPCEEVLSPADHGTTRFFICPIVAVGGGIPWDKWNSRSPWVLSSSCRQFARDPFYGVPQLGAPKSGDRFSLHCCGDSCPQPASLLSL